MGHCTGLFLPIVEVMAILRLIMVHHSVTLTISNRWQQNNNSPTYYGDGDLEHTSCPTLNCDSVLKFGYTFVAGAVTLKLPFKEHSVYSSYKAEPTLGQWWAINMPLNI